MSEGPKDRLAILFGRINTYIPAFLEGIHYTKEVLGD